MTSLSLLADMTVVENEFMSFHCHENKILIIKKTAAENLVY